MRRARWVVLWSAFLLAAPAVAVVVGNVVEDSQTFPPITAGPGGSLASAEWFGKSIAKLGDIDSDGKMDLLVGSPFRNDGGTHRGAVWVVNIDAFDVATLGTRLSDGSGGFPAGLLTDNAEFGGAVESLGDLDGDGYREIVVGAPGSGKIWFIDTNPTTGAAVRQTSVSSAAGNRYGYGLAALGDLKPGDGINEYAIAVGEPFDDEGAFDAGAVHILFLDATTNPAVMAVSHSTKIRAGIEVPGTWNWFGTSVTPVGDLNQDGVTDLAVGAPGPSSPGAVHILLMNANGTMKSTGSFVINAGTPGLSLAANDEFGSSVAWLGDPVSVGGGVLAVGTRGADLGRSPDPGAVWLVTIDYDLTIANATAIGHNTNWNGTLGDYAWFGFAVASLGNWPARNAVGGTIEAPVLAVGAPNTVTGNLYIMDLEPCPLASAAPAVYHSPADNGKQSCITVRQKPGENPALNLYLQTGKAVTPNPANRCADGLGTGDELCGWDVRLTFTGFTAQTFTSDPAIAGAVAVSSLPSSSQLRLNWVDPVNPLSPATGRIRLGKVTLTNTTTTGNVKVSDSSGAVRSDLSLVGISARTLYAPEPGRLALLAAGIAALGWLARRRARTSAALLIALLGGSAIDPAPASAATSVKGWNFIAYWDGNTNFQYPQDGSSFNAIGTGVLPLGVRAGLPMLLVGDFEADGGAVFRFFLAKNGRAFQPAGLDSVLRFGATIPLAGGVSGWVGTHPSFGLPGVGALRFGASLAKLGALSNGDPVVAIGITGLRSTSYVDQIAIASIGEDGRATLIRVLDNPATDVQEWGTSLAALGDLDGDGIGDLAVGAIYNASVHLLFLNADYSVKTTTLINAGFPGFSYGSCGECGFGQSLAALGDLDGNGTRDLAVGQPNGSRVHILLLEPNGGSGLRVKAGGQVVLGETGVNGFPFDVNSPNHTFFGAGLGWLGDDTLPAQGGGVLAVSAKDANLASASCGTVFMLRLRPDGTVRRGYKINRFSGVGYAPTNLKNCTGNNGGWLGYSIAKLPDLDGDEVPDVVVGTPYQQHLTLAGAGAAVILFMQDTDHDGLDDNLDNCPTAHNPAQVDADGDTVGDLCDNCPVFANTPQGDVDSDGEGDSCEPVELQLTATGTPASPSWSLSVECGAFNVTQVNAGIVLPAGATNPKTLTLNGPSIGAGSATSGPGLSSPSGVRSDAIYFSALGNGSGGRLCTALDLPTFLGTLTTGSIGGTQLAASALSAEGVGVPGFGLAVARTAAGNIASSDVRLTNSDPLPILRLELGPAVVTSGGTRWDVIAKNASAEFHRVTFGLIAPNGTTTSQMRWVGCNTAPSGSGVRSCTGGTGFGPTTSATNSFTQGPLAAPPGTQLPHTLYVSLVGNRPSQASQLTFNPVNGPTQVTVGTIELDSSPDLQPALTVDGVESVAASPLVKADGGASSPTQLRLVGEFDPAEDLDGDEIQDLSDNCPFAFNPAQTNRGSFASNVDSSDALGDACQCGESTDDGAVFASDFDQIRAYLLGEITNPSVIAQIEARCSVAGPTDCNVRDLVVLKKAIAAGSPSVPTRCDAALSPATP